MKVVSITSTTAILTSVLLPFATIATAQVTPDGTTSTTVNSTPTRFQIENGDRAGGNLFHSFGEFSIPTGSEAYFNNANDIVNIFSRVTGGNFSNIDGLIRANGTANLFLINPAGILFGPNASLQLGGSFFGSTANSIVFPDGEFSATDLDNPPLITINAPIGLGFRDEPQPIINQSTANNLGLQINPGEIIGLIGGEIAISGNGVPSADSEPISNITAQGAKVWLGGLAEAGTVTLDENLNPSLPNDVTRADIFLVDGARIDVASASGGEISLIGNNVILTGASQLFGGITADSTSIEAQAGDITIDATGAVNLSEESNIINRVFENATGNSGDINVTAESLSLTEGGYLSASLLQESQGTGGDINVNTTGAVTLDGVGEGENPEISRMASVIGTGAKGEGGNVTINAGSLSITNGALLNTQVFAATEELPGGKGDAGDITINAEGTVTISDFNEASSQNSSIISTLQIDAEGNAGNVSVTAENLNLTAGGTINSSTFGQGNAGNVNLEIENNLEINSETAFSAISSNVENNAVGNGGNVTINAGSLSLLQGGQIQAGVRGQIQGFVAGEGNAGNVTVNVDRDLLISGFNGVPSGILSSLGIGTVESNAGNVSVTAENLNLTAGGTINSSTFGQGNAGNVNLEIKNNLEINSETAFSVISSNVDHNAVGNGGNVTINAGSLSLLQGGQIQAIVRDENLQQELAAGKGNAGNVTVNVDGDLLISGFNGFSSGILSYSGIGTVESNAGDVSVTAENLNLTAGGKVSASTFGQGNAGKVTINASDTISAIGENSPDSVSGIFSTVEASGVGDAEGIDITTANLTLEEGGVVNASTFGQGNAGQVTINASDTISAIGENSQGSVSAIGSTVGSSVDSTTGKSIVAVGDGGGIDITTANLTLEEGGVVNASTFGQGNAGQVTINASDTISATGTSSQGFASAIGSTVGIFTNPITRELTIAEGDAGKVTVNANSLKLEDGAAINSSSFGRGNAGAIELNINDAIELKGTSNLTLNGIEQSFSSGIFSSINTFTNPITGELTIAEGDAGNVTVTAENLNLTDGGRINASTFGQGNAGKVTINASDTISVIGENSQNFLVSGIFSTVESGAVGNAEGIEITTANLTLEEGGVVNASTFGKGDAGGVSITASDTISVTGTSSQGSVSTIGSTVGSFADSTTGKSIVAVGDGGGIDITTANLTLEEGGVVNASTFGQGNAGQVTINASDTISATGTSSQGFVSAIGSTVGIFTNPFTGELTIAEGNAGDVTVTAENLNLIDGGQVNTSTFGLGNAGKVTINASNTISATGDNSQGSVSGIFSSINTFPNAFTGELIIAEGNAGGIEITTANLILADGGVVNASTFGKGNAGGVKITTENLTITNRGAIGSSVFGQGNGGNVTITTDSLSMNNGSEISASNTGTGSSGSVSVEADNLSLDNGTISAINQPPAATEEPQQGGDVKLSIAENIILRNSSRISAQATENAKGGNVNINANFIIAYPSDGEGNDILASAEQGEGGNINITAEGLLNIEERKAPNYNSTNDINASSQVDGLDGSVTINTPDSNPIRDNTKLTQNVVASTVETTDACSVSETGEIEASGLVVKGKGGVPPEPTEPINADNLIVDSEITSNVSQNNNSQNNNNVGTFHGTSLQNPEEIPSHIQPVAYRDNGEPIYLARGVIVQEDGSIILTAYPTDRDRFRTPQPSEDCRSDD
jgi:filamentous hemagglutinin family protein